MTAALPRAWWRRAATSSAALSSEIRLVFRVWFWPWLVYLGSED